MIDYYANDWMRVSLKAHPYVASLKYQSLLMTSACDIILSNVNTIDRYHIHEGWSHWCVLPR